MKNRLPSILKADHVSQDLDLSQFRKLLAIHFNKDELSTLCFDLNIEYENLPAETLNGKTRELVKYCYRNGRLTEILQLCQEMRPNVIWAQSTFNNEDASQKSPADQPTLEFYQLVKAFNRNRHLPFSDNRTIQGDEIAYQMRELAPLLFDRFDVGHWLNNNSIGKRLAAITYLHWAQDIEFFESLIERLFVEKPFLQFRILLTLDNMVDQLDSQYRQLLQDKLSTYEPKGNGNRLFWKERILGSLTDENTIVGSKNQVRS